jgi:hypothetical protein
MNFEINTRGPTIGSEVLQAATAGAPDAWNQIVEAYAGLVWEVARRRQLTREGAENVSRLTWMRLADRLGDMSPESLGSWLGHTADRESVRVARLLTMEEEEARPA